MEEHVVDEQNAIAQQCLNKIDVMIPVDSGGEKKSIREYRFTPSCHVPLQTVQAYSQS